MQSYLGRTNYFLREAYAYCAPEYQSRMLQLAQEDTDTLEYLVNSLLYGDKSLNVRAGIASSPDIYRLALVDGCVGIDRYYTADQCSNFQYGIFTRGWLGGFSEYIHLVRQMIAEKRDALAAGVCPASSLNSVLDDTRLTTIDQMRWRYVTAGLFAMATVRARDADALFQLFISLNIAVTVSCLVALLLIDTCFYHKLVLALDRDIKRTRTLLQLFPDDVTRAIPSLLKTGATTPRSLPPGLR